LQRSEELAVQHTVYVFDGFQLDVTRRKLVSTGGLVQPLNSRAMEALLVLVQNAGELVEKRRLMQTVWPNAVVEDNNLNQCVLAIRKALGETAGSNRYIMTVPGRGYRFVTPVRAMVQESAPEAVVSVTAARHPQRSLMWLAGAAVVCIVAVSIQLLRIEAGVKVPVIPAVESGTAGNSGSGESLLRLHDPIAGPGASMPPAATDVLAKCLAARPNLKLRIRIELMPESGAPVWTGDYIASSKDLIAGGHDTSSSTSGCNDLITSLASQ
jgi:DNA-binding winged helix-turn-helix (wHTH) protein